MISAKTHGIIKLHGYFVMKKFYLLTFVFFITLILISCASIPSDRNRQLFLTNGYTISESEHGGVERWYAVDKYNYDSLSDEIRFQVGYFRDDNILGFILWGTGTTGESAFFSRQGLDLRWNWGFNGSIYDFNYSFIIRPDGTGLYYDFSTSTDGTAKPRGIYKVHKF